MATVYVWTTKFQMPDMSKPTLEEKAISAIRNIGHSSLLCNKLSLKFTTSGQDMRYISYWPDEGVSLKSSSSKSYNTPSYSEDVDAEGGEPDIIVDLPCLNDELIAQWWSAFLDKRGFIGPYHLRHWPKDDHYDLWRTNCSTLVALAMKIGGSDQFSMTPAESVDTLGKVASYAKEIAMNAKIGDFFKVVRYFFDIL